MINIGCEVNIYVCTLNMTLWIFSLVNILKEFFSIWIWRRKANEGMTAYIKILVAKVFMNTIWGARNFSYINRHRIKVHVSRRSTLIFLHTARTEYQKKDGQEQNLTLLLRDFHTNFPCHCILIWRKIY